MRRSRLSVVAGSLQSSNSRNGSLICVLLAALTCVAVAQDPNAGIMPYSTQAQGKIDFIDLATGSVFIKIPVRSKIREIPLDVSLFAQSRAYIYLGGVTVDGWFCCTINKLVFIVTNVGFAISWV